jgi:hypothetical protein
VRFCIVLRHSLRTWPGASVSRHQTRTFAQGRAPLTFVQCPRLMVRVGVYAGLVDEWITDQAREVARELMEYMGIRWAHVQAVGVAAEELVDRGAPEVVASAGWLHDIGYAASAVATGFHPLDGARHLVRLGAPSEVVSLVAYHTGAEFEAAERGLTYELKQFVRPTQEALDALTWADLANGPGGERVSVDQRLAEILQRYPEEHPVHRATRASSSYLRDCAARAEARYADALRT